MKILYRFGNCIVFKFVQSFLLQYETEDFSLMNTYGIRLSRENVLHEFRLLLNMET